MDTTCRVGPFSHFTNDLVSCISNYKIKSYDVNIFMAITKVRPSFSQFGCSMKSNLCSMQENFQKSHDILCNLFLMIFFLHPYNTTDKEIPDLIEGARQEGDDAVPD